MRHPERCVNVAMNPVDIAIASPTVRPGRLARLGLLGAALVALSGCASRGCGNPYVLDFLDHADRQADLTHVGLLRAPVSSAPGATPDRLSCSVWEQVRPVGTSQLVLRPQYYHLQHVSDGWKLSP